MTNTGQLIREERKKQRYTVQQVADGIERSKTAVSEAELGATRGSVDILLRISDFLGVDFNCLLACIERDNHEDLLKRFSDYERKRS